MKLEELVAAALARREQPAISGWGLGNPDNALFDWRVTGPRQGCESDTCQHYSHDEADNTYSLFPRAGKLHLLAQDGNLEYFALRGDTETYWRVDTHMYFHTEIYRLTPQKIPDFFLIGLAKEIAV